MWHFLHNSQRFKEEVSLWVSNGWITADQADLLATQYQLNAPAPWYRRTSFILQAVALLLAAMGFLLLIAMNWESLPIAVRTLVGIAPLFATYFVAVWQYQKDNESAAELAMFFGCLLFGANIALQAQIYHISAYFPDGVLWWILGSLPVVFFFRSNFLVVVLQGLFFIWLLMQWQYAQFSFWGVILLGAFGVFLYRNPNPFHLVSFFTTGFVFMLNLLIVSQQAVGRGWHTVEVAMLLLPAVYGILFYAALQLIRKQYDESLLLRFQNFLNTGFLFMLYWLTFGFFTQEVLAELVSYPLPFLLPVLYLLGLGIGLWQRSQMNFYFWFNAVLTGIWLSAAYTNKDMAAGYTVLFNLLLLGILVHKIYSGIQQQNKSLFMWGVGYMVVLALSRYISLIGGDFFLTGVLFILCGLGILALNRFWNKKFD